MQHFMQHQSGMMLYEMWCSFGEGLTPYVNSGSNKGILSYCATVYFCVPFCVCRSHRNHHCRGNSTIKTKVIDLCWKIYKENLMGMAI